MDYRATDTGNRLPCALAANSVEPAATLVEAMKKWDKLEHTTDSSVHGRSFLQSQMLGRRSIVPSATLLSE